MADYFTNVSFVVEMSEENSAWVLGLHSEICSRLECWGEEKPEIKSEYDGIVRQFIEDFTCDGDCSVSMEFVNIENKSCLWIHGESTNIDYLASIMQLYLKHFALDQFIAFEWSSDCSRPRTDAYGGGAMFVSKDIIDSMTTGEWRQERVKKFTENAA